jgi:hypothetical protein
MGKVRGERDQHAGQHYQKGANDSKSHRSMPND